MVSVARYLLLLTLVVVAACQNPATSLLATSKNDRVNRWFGPRTHYEHVVRDSSGAIRDVYRYYFDEHGRPVLDGERVIYRWEHDPGLVILYRDGREVRRSEAIVTG